MTIIPISALSRHQIDTFLARWYFPRTFERIMRTTKDPRERAWAIKELARGAATMVDAGSAPMEDVVVKGGPF